MKKWTYETCKEETSKYEFLIDFRKLSETAYKVIRRNKWFELIKDLKTLNFWTYEECKIESLKYKTKKELKINNISIYNKISKNKWYELYEHTEHLGNRFKRLIYTYEFPDNCCYIGLTYDMNIRNNRHYSSKRSQVYKHMEETGLIPKLIEKTIFLDVKEASIMEGKIEKEYKDNGWEILNKIKTGNVGGNQVKWTYEKCKIEADKYTNLKDFYTNSYEAYRAIRKNNWDLCLDKEGIKPNGYWNNKERCYNEALKYKNRTTLSKENPTVYKYSKLNSWLDEFYK